MTQALDKVRQNNEISFEALDNTLALVDKVITRQYLGEIAEKDIVPASNQIKQVADVLLFRLKMLVFNPMESITEKLVTVYSSLLGCITGALSIAIIIRSRTSGIEFYFAVNADGNSVTARKVLATGLLGNFPGTSIEPLSPEEGRKLLQETMLRAPLHSVSCLTVLPSDRESDMGEKASFASQQNSTNEQFTQGLEKFIDAMRGREYTAVILAQALDRNLVTRRKLGLEAIYSALTPHSKLTLGFTDGESASVGKGVSDSTSESLSKGVSYTVTDGENWSYSNGGSYGNTDSVGGGGFNWGSSSSTNYSESQGRSHSESHGESTTETRGSQHAESSNVTFGTSKSMSRTVEFHNKYIENLMGIVERNIRRINEARSYGLWECACYFIVDRLQDAILTANTFKGLLTGSSTGEEDCYVNEWSHSNGDRQVAALKSIRDYLVCLRHPRFNFSRSFQDIVTPACMVNGRNLAALMGVPRHSVPGVVVYSIAEFGRNVFVKKAVKSAGGDRNRRIRLGNVYHMGADESETAVELDLDSLTSHCFIAGSTGSGKSNTTYGLVEKIANHGVNFLVVEPAKGEYKIDLGNMEGLSVYTTNQQYEKMLRINPFSFPEEIHVLEHLDRLIEIFNVCWEMTNAMPALLKSAIERAYQSCGWDLPNSFCRSIPIHYPTFQDLLRELPIVIKQSGYSERNQSDYIGALVSRVKSLTNGIFGQIFCSGGELSDSSLFDGRVIVDLSRIGSLDSKSLLMGILVMKLTEYRTAKATGTNRGLRHITVLEEAHNLLKNVKNTGSNPLASKSVEMLCNSIAEMRTYGEGFIIVDQSPTAVDIAAIKNTNTKIIMKLPEKVDGDIAGNTFGLDEFQKGEIPKLPTGVAIVMQNNWVTPVLTHIDAFDPSHKYRRPLCPVTMDEIKAIRGCFISAICQFHHGKCKASELPGIVEKELDARKLPKRKSEEYLEMFGPRLVTLKTMPNIPVGQIPQDMCVATVRLMIDIMNCHELKNRLVSQIRKMDSLIKKCKEINDKGSAEWKSCQEEYVKEQRLFFRQLRDNLAGYVEASMMNKTDNCDVLWMFWKKYMQHLVRS